MQRMPPRVVVSTTNLPDDCNLFDEKSTTTPDEPKVSGYKDGEGLMEDMIMKVVKGLMMVAKRRKAKKGD